MANASSAPQDNNLLHLPPDGYSRFFVLIRSLEEIYKTSTKTIRILDVGGCSPYVRQGLKATKLKFELTVVDILPQPEDVPSPYIQDDITESKLPDASFDVVISTDVMEHIPKDRKDIFVKACVRLAKDLVIIAAPFDTDAVDYTEHVVNDFNKQLFGAGQDWLEEHFAFTKPKIQQVIKILTKLPVTYEHFGANNLFSWALSTHLNLINAKAGLDLQQMKRVNRKYNHLLASSPEFSAPTYRHFFVIYKDKKLNDGPILPRITGPQEPQQFVDYIHAMMDIVYQRIHELNNQAVASESIVEQLEQQLINERHHTEKLNQQLVEVHAELKRLIPLRRIAKLRHPAQVAAAVKRRAKGK